LQADNRLEAEFIVTVALPYYLRIPDTAFHCPQYNLSTQLQEQSIGDPAKAPHLEGRDTAFVCYRVATGELTGAKGIETPGAMLRYTLVSIAFRRIIDRPDISEAHEQQIINIVHKYLNHFINVYRIISGDIEVRPLTKAELCKVRAGRGLHMRATIHHGNSDTLQSGIIGTPFIARGLDLLTQTQIEEIRTKLESNQTPLLAPLLLLNAESYIYTGEHKLAVIDMNTALDISVEQKALHLLVKEGMPDDEARTKLEKQLTVQIVENILLPKITANDKDKFPWIEWKDKFRPLRNKVVHDGYEPTAAEAIASLETVSKIFWFINSWDISKNVPGVNE
jgi:hypothetical protein